MRLTIALTTALISSLVWIGASGAEPRNTKTANAEAAAVTLVELGVFAQVTTRPSGFGVETQTYELNQREAAALVDSAWLPDLCSTGVPLNDRCVRVLEVKIKSTQPYSPVYLHLMRAGAETNLIEWDNNKVGGVAVSSVSGEEGHWLSVTYALGMITPQKTHTLRIWSPSAGPGNGAHVMSGLRILAIPASGK